MSLCWPRLERPIEECCTEKVYSYMNSISAYKGSIKSSKETAENYWLTCGLAEKFWLIKRCMFLIEERLSWPILPWSIISQPNMSLFWPRLEQLIEECWTEKVYLYRHSILSNKGSIKSSKDMANNYWPTCLLAEKIWLIIKCIVFIEVRLSQPNCLGQLLVGKTGVYFGQMYYGRMYLCRIGLFIFTNNAYF